jgi:beta-phosphoglucomutase-like phosphatase (HAD superfamily)/dTDP-glucose pyrophosphorylase
MKNRLFIFDLDGVLVDSKKIHFDSLNQALLSVGKKYVISDEDQKNIFEGLSTNQKLDILTEIRGLPEHQHDLIWKDKQNYSLEFFKNLRPDDDLINIFHTIKSNNIKIAVASNSIRKTVEYSLNSLGLINYVDFYISNEDVKNPKPFPDMYMKCISHCKSSIKDTVIFEDSYIGKIGAFQSKARLVSIKSREHLTLEKVLDEIDYKSKNINILIPMAGDGKRFLDQGYLDPKPLTNINNKKMIQVVYDNINIDGNYIYIAKKEHAENHSLHQTISSFCDNFTLILQNKKLDGAVKSCLLAKDLIDNDQPLIIANSDQYIFWDSKKTIDYFLKSGIDGAILTFKANDTKWSYVKRNKYNIVSAVAEKNIISNEATCGLYFWRKGSDFIKYAEAMVDKDIKTNNEFYVCPVYNEAIADEKIIVAYLVDQMYGLGTPEDLELFLQRKINV